MKLDKIKWESFNGMMVVGDIHGEYTSLAKVVKYAVDNKYFLLFLGDFVDGGRRPFETVELVLYVLDHGLGASIIGNHEKKFYRYFIGNDVKMKDAQRQTLADAGDVSKFRELMIALVEHEMSSHIIKFKNAIFAHGAVHKSCWESLDDSKTQRNTCWYGEVLRNEYDVRGFKKRTYGWVGDIPAGHITVTGHDFEAMGKEPTKPKIATHANGGTAYFVDTGCGKQDVVGHKLTAALFSVNINNDLLGFERFEVF